MIIEENKALKNFNSFRIDAFAKYFVSVKNSNDILELIETDIYKNNEFFILGSGSNVLFADDFNGLIINIEIKGMHILESTDDFIILDVGAGEDWDTFVKTCVKSGYYGVENLALIPGKVGAAPVQNIGAYGAEQQDCFVSLNGVNLHTKETVKLNFDGCKFAYRYSIFKEELKDKFIITFVQYKLSKQKKFNFSYMELENEVNKFPAKEIDLQYVYDTVCRLRKSKLPDGEKIGNAGSFFKNPIVDMDFLSKLKIEYPDIKNYPANDNSYKLSAGWLIEQCGWKDKRFGDAGVFDQHALVLVNHGNASGYEILSLSKKIQDSVEEKFGVKLEPEVLIVPNQ